MRRGREQMRGEKENRCEERRRTVRRGREQMRGEKENRCEERRRTGRRGREPRGEGELGCS